MANLTINRKKIEIAFSIFMNLIQDLNINWALTGSFRLYLEDKKILIPNDIDIITDTLGIEIIKNTFFDNIHRDFSFSRSNNIESLFGQLLINDVMFDIMASVHNNVNGNWINLPNLEGIEYIIFDFKQIPVLSLSNELAISIILGQKSKERLIRTIIETKPK